MQGADWHFGPHNFGTQPEYVRKAALATMIICFIGFVAYLIFLVSIFIFYNPTRCQWLGYTASLFEPTAPSLI